MEKRLIIKFKGNKAEIRNQLKSACALAGKSMNSTVIEIIQKHLEEDDTRR